MSKKFGPILFFGALTIIFFWQFFFKGLLPIPSDTIVGLYHPYRDYYSADYPNGIPFKNFLITDPVRQQFPWKKLITQSFKKSDIPFWNPYSFSGTPNIANFQTGAFYQFNLLFLFFPLAKAWTILVILQPFLAGIFMYLFLKNLKIDVYSAMLGGSVFAFGGFFATWLEWGTVLHSALWLPLILLSIDKLFLYLKEFKISNIKYQILNRHFKNKKIYVWFFILLISSVSSFFAGHLQIFFYVFIVSLAYFLLRWISYGRKLNILFPFAVFGILFLVITSIQWIPTLNFLNLSARSFDQNFLTSEGWFIPFQHLIQFVVPDFFGNPATLNYWGIWNYGELTPYIGIAPLIFAVYALFFRKERNTLFFGIILFMSLFFALPTFVAKIPFILDIPFLSSAQPTRLIFLINFSLAVLSALGLNHFLDSKNKHKIIIPIISLFIFLMVMFGLISFERTFTIDPVNLSVAKRNLILPILILSFSSILITFSIRINNKFRDYLIILIIFITVFDLFRFSHKFNTFSKEEYLYPPTETTKFLSENIGVYRVISSDPRIFPPNFSIIYNIQSAEGYDPLFLTRYAEYISAINRGIPNIGSPFGFNRILRIENIDTPQINLLGIKYVLSLSDISRAGLVKVHEEGQTKVYENTNVYPRAFFVDEVIESGNKQESIDIIFDPKTNLLKTAVIEGEIERATFNSGTAKIIKYSPDEIEIETENNGTGFLVLTDSFYPSWHAKIGNRELEIFRTDYNFRGIFVPKGKNKVIFYNTLL